MKTAAVFLLVLFSALPAGAQQEKPVPKDAARISIAGCAHKSTFIVARPPEGEPVRSDIEPGRRFKLHGQKQTLGEIKAHSTDMIEVTGLIRRADLEKPRGVGLAGGRIRIGGGNPQSPLGDPATSSPYNEAIMDVESWRPLPASCSSR
jgi:hypothetical protein